MGATILTSAGDSWDFDIVTGEDHQHPAEWPTSPVEDGADVSDHCHLSPHELSLDGLVTDDNDDGEIDRSKKVYEALLGIREARQLVTVITDLRVYTTMGITGVSNSRSPNTGKAIAPSVSLREIRIVNSISIPIPPEILSPPVRSSGQSTADLEKQALDMTGDGTEGQPFALKPPDWSPSGSADAANAAMEEAAQDEAETQALFDEYFW